MLFCSKISGWLAITGLIDWDISWVCEPLSIRESSRPEPSKMIRIIEGIMIFLVLFIASLNSCFAKGFLRSFDQII